MKRKKNLESAGDCTVQWQAPWGHRRPLRGQIWKDNSVMVRSRERAWLLGRMGGHRLAATEVRLERTEKFHGMVTARPYCRHR